MKIALVLNDDFSMYHFRKGLIRSLCGHGHAVTVIVPPGRYVKKIESMGARVVTLPIKRFISPLADLLMLYRLWRIFSAGAFDIVHNMTVKPNIFGTYAAFLAGVPKTVCLVSGTGFGFSGGSSIRQKALNLMLVALYTVALHRADRTWFQNPDDLSSFVQDGIIPKEKAVLIRSGGINTSEFSIESVTKQEIEQVRREFSIPSNAQCVLMVAARLIWSKGVREFVEAAEALASRFPDWYFIMVCPKDPGSPDHVPDSYLHKLKIERLVVVDSFRSDIKVIEAMADIMVLPSYYREGVPRTLLEALSMGKPIITTDHPGCREAVEESKNGFLITVRNSEALADRLAILMSDPDKRYEFGRWSRHKAVHEFDEELVVQSIFQNLYGISVS